MRQSYLQANKKDHEPTEKCDTKKPFTMENRD